MIARSEPEVMWLLAVGLERRSPLIGLQPLMQRAGDPDRDWPRPIEAAIYQPISGFFGR
jgi:hypothetical protein